MYLALVPHTSPHAAERKGNRTERNGMVNHVCVSLDQRTPNTGVCRIKHFSHHTRRYRFHTCTGLGSRSMLCIAAFWFRDHGPLSSPSQRDSRRIGTTEGRVGGPLTSRWVEGSNGNVMGLHKCSRLKARRDVVQQTNRSRVARK